MYTYRILQNYSNDMFHSSLITFEKDSYLFNCSDGTQRNALDQGIKFTKINSIFYSSSHSNCYLGTFGLVMSRTEQSQTKTPLNQVNLYGPPNFHSNFKHCSHICPVPLKNNIYNYNPIKEGFINENISNSPIYKEFKDNNITIIPISINTQIINAMSYICIPALKTPPFLPSKAKALGIKPGPIYGRLQKGETVTLENGQVIKPESVLGDPIPSSSILILYIPSYEHMKLLIQNEIIKNFINNVHNNKILTKIVNVIHIVPMYSIINNDEYIAFMASFGKYTQHIIDCRETNRQFMYNEGKIKIQILLNKVSDYLFNKASIPYEDTLAVKELSLIKSNTLLVSECVPGREYIIYPHEKRGISFNGLNSGEAFYFQSENYKKFISYVSTIPIEIFNKTENNNDIIDVEPKVTFLGTTSMKPCKYRNVTSILIQLNHTIKTKYVMFDCGEGTYQQLLEQYGIKCTNEILKELKLIFISHKHGDHVLGLVKLLNEIDVLLNDNYNNDYMFVIVPVTVINFVKHSIQNELIHKDYFKLFNSETFNPNTDLIYLKNLCQDNPYDNFEDIKKETSYENIKTKLIDFRNNNKHLYNELHSHLGIYFYSIEVFHCNFSFGCFIENSSLDINEDNNKTYFKISFSGDTRPCNNFFNYTMNSSLLIHEATFDSELIKDAMEKMHTTITEAINIAKTNNSKYIALTHFSPRYIKTYPFLDIFEQQNVLIAHDYLSFYLSDLKFAYKYLKYFDKVIQYIEQNKEEI